MSTIQVFPQAAGPNGVIHRQEAKSAPVPAPQKSSRYPDREMMYAWSIGTTTVARSLSQAMREKEVCPPETYIG
jgi:hypothetical protein